MQIVDLTDNYSSSYIKANNREEYERSFPELFDHYYRFWTKSELAMARVGADDIQTRKRWINRLLQQLDKILAKHAIDCDDITYVYFIGVGTTNGHAFRYDDRFHVWLPLETYTSEALVKTFVTHELVHALHYYYSASFYFSNGAEKIQLSRQLITEGVATYLTKTLLGISALESLWADYLSENDARKWEQTCQKEEVNLLRLIFKDYYSSDHESGIFYASRPDDIYHFRSGYYIGLRLVEYYAQMENLTAFQLLKLPRNKFEGDILNLIRSRL